MDAKICRADGDHRWIRVTASVLRSEGRATHLYGMKQDVTQELECLDLLRKSVDRDALTGLASRHLFQTRFLDASAVARATFPVSALVLFDVDGFKRINDDNGHAAGDLCLKIIATRLTESFVDPAMIARIGGDEFAVLLRGSVEEHVSKQVAACLSNLTRPFSWNGRLLRVSASAGIALADGQGTCEPDRIFSAADDALYRAKRSGRNRMRLAAA
jgi:diguanylate cyclase (GGDEF)-like protein